MSGLTRTVSDIHDFAEYLTARIDDGAVEVAPVRTGRPRVKLSSVDQIAIGGMTRTVSIRDAGQVLRLSEGEKAMVTTLSS